MVNNTIEVNGKGCLGCRKLGVKGDGGTLSPAIVTDFGRAP
jgi:hypothetical protein